MKTRKTYDPDFKEKAVSLCALRGSIKEVAEELGLRPDLLRRWKREFDQYQKNSGYNGLNCATHFGFTVPLVSV